ncbi:hypothetical protein AUF78_02315 [archaeon 13_1_20CM_2_51_12]|nr:MAG: hypothetical protein AUF78_02315 [archaeon 13_1_20CM_2_51_12]
MYGILGIFAAAIIGSVVLIARRRIKEPPFRVSVAHPSVWGPQLFPRFQGASSPAQVSVEPPKPPEPGVR